MASVVLDDGFKPETAIAALEVLTPVYGRGETITYKGRDIALIMMKNLPSLQANLDAVTHPLENVWISVDEGTPDPSWIFDTDTSALSSVSVLSGTKAWQWVSLLEHRGIPYGEIIEDSRAGLDAFVKRVPAQNGPLHAIVNYEQMMLIRRIAGYKELEGRDGLFHLCALIARNARPERVVPKRIHPGELSQPRRSRCENS